MPFLADVRKREIKALAKASLEMGCRNLVAITWDEYGREDAGGASVEIVPLEHIVLQIPSSGGT